MSISPLDLHDPVTCGEDLLGNAERISELAPENCGDCADYHIRHAFQRYCGLTRGIAHDRAIIVQKIREILGANTGERIDFLIAGAVDTGILATCAHAAAKMGGAFLERSRFTVLDRCLTPLLLCQEFAGRHKLDLETAQIDLLASPGPFSADVIVAHSVLRFVDQARQASLLGAFGRWLKPGGRMLISNSLRSGSPSEIQTEIRKRGLAGMRAQELLKSGKLRTREPPEQIMRRLERSRDKDTSRTGDFQSLEDAQSLFARTGLGLVSLEGFSWNVELAPGEVIEKKRFLAVLEARNYPL